MNTSDALQFIPSGENNRMRLGLTLQNVGCAESNDES